MKIVQSYIILLHLDSSLAAVIMPATEHSLMTFKVRNRSHFICIDIDCDSNQYSLVCQEYKLILNVI